MSTQADIGSDQRLISSRLNQQPSHLDTMLTYLQQRLQKAHRRNNSLLATCARLQTNIKHHRNDCSTDSDKVRLQGLIDQEGRAMSESEKKLQQLRVSSESDHLHIDTRIADTKQRFVKLKADSKVAQTMYEMMADVYGVQACTDQLCIHHKQQQAEQQDSSRRCDDVADNWQLVRNHNDANRSAITQ